MKIYLNCKSKLLGEVLSLYLDDLLSAREDADIEVTDFNQKSSLPLCLISNLNNHKDIRRPITQESLLRDIRDFILKLQPREQM